MNPAEKLDDRTCVVLTKDLKQIISMRAASNERSFSQQLRKDLASYYDIICKGVSDDKR